MEFSACYAHITRHNSYFFGSWFIEGKEHARTKGLHILVNNNKLKKKKLIKLKKNSLEKITQQKAVATRGLWLRYQGKVSKVGRTVQVSKDSQTNTYASLLLNKA